MRLFIAIHLSEAQRSAVLSAQQAFRAAGVRGNYTPAENLHLTLAFIGEYPDPDAVLAAMEEMDFAPFDLTLRGLGAFGDLWWIGIADNPALAACVRSLRRALAEAGVPFDRKRFSPHITLVRRAVPGAKGFPGIGVPAVTARVDRVSLMRSDRGKGGMIYTALGSRE